MKILTVTITGADDNCEPDALLRMSDEYKKTTDVEWGLLISKNSEGQPQYPTTAWMEEFIAQASGHAPVSGHMNGTFLREILAGTPTYHIHHQRCWQGFQRVQLNFAKREWEVEIPGFFVWLKQWTEKRFIFQMEGVNERLFYYAMDGGVNALPLFDCSLGLGTLPEAWPTPIHPFYNGYAGGLGPDNLKEQLERIEEVVGNGVIWIDMTTHVRTDNKLDLDKVRRVLDVVAERS